MPPELRDAAFVAQARAQTSATAARARRARRRGRQQPVQAVARLQLRPDPGPARPMRRALAHRPRPRRRRRVRLLVAGAGDERRHGRHRYTVELDNAFGLIEGADVKVAGVRAGKITDLRLDRETNHALVDFEVDQTRASARCAPTCSARRGPQSLIGEYFIDCQPGTHAAASCAAASTIPVEQTGSTIPPRPRQQHPAPPVPRAPADHPRRARRRRSPPAATTSTRRSAAPARRCARPTRCSPILGAPEPDARAT